MLHPFFACGIFACPFEMHKQNTIFTIIFHASRVDHKDRWWFSLSADGMRGFPCLAVSEEVAWKITDRTLFLSNVSLIALIRIIHAHLKFDKCTCAFVCTIEWAERNSIPMVRDNSQTNHTIPFQIQYWNIFVLNILCFLRHFFLSLSFQLEANKCSILFYVRTEISGKCHKYDTIISNPLRTQHSNTNGSAERYCRLYKLIK